MSFSQTLRNFLKEPRLNGVDPDSDELLVIHSTVLQEKQMMREVFAEFYATCINLDNQYFSCSSKKRIEIGSSQKSLCSLDGPKQGACAEPP